MVQIEPYGQVKLKGILFGDDNWGTILDEEVPRTNEKGIPMKRYLIVPGEHLMKQYPELQKPGALTYQNYALWVEYPLDFVHDSNPSRTNAIVRVDCAFDGRETYYTKINKRYTEEIRTLREELEIQQISNMHLTDEVKQLLTDKKEMFKDLMEISNMMKGGDRNDPNNQYIPPPAP